MTAPTTQEALDNLWKIIDDDWEKTMNASCSLQDLDAKMKALEELQTSISEGIISRTTRMRHLRNGSTPFHSLPAELFVNVLSWSMDVANWEIKQVHELAQVSKHWRDTVLSSPVFWPCISLRQSTEINKIVLQRNKTASLAVWCNAEGYSADDVQAFFKIAAELPDRWRAMTYAGECNEAAMKHVSLDSPNLCDLFLRQAGDPGSGKPHVPLEAGIPLRHLSLEGFSVPWDSPRLTGLQSFNIIDLSWNLPTPSQLFNILALSPRLRRLVIWKLYPEDPSDVNNLEELCSLDSVNLPVLGTLILSAMPKLWVRQLLRKLKTKVCKCIIMDHAHVSHLDDTNFQDLISPSIAAAPGMEIKFSTTHQGIYVLSSKKPNMSREWFHWAQDEPGINIFLSMWNCPREAWSALGPLVRLNESAEGVCLKISGDESGDNPSLFPSTAFMEFPNVHAIEMKLPYDEVLANLRYLASPVASESSGGGLKWPCPKLSSVQVKVHGLHGRKTVVSDLLLTLVRRRHGSDVNGGVLTVVDPPKPLQKIIIDSSILSELPEGGPFEAVHLSSP